MGRMRQFRFLKPTKKALSKHHKLARLARVCVCFLFFQIYRFVFHSLVLTVVVDFLFWVMQTIGYTKDMIKESPSQTYTHAQTLKVITLINLTNNEWKTMHTTETANNISNASHTHKHTHIIFELWNGMKSSVFALGSTHQPTTRNGRLFACPPHQNG